MATVLTVNIGTLRANPARGATPTGIDKRPSDSAVIVRAPVAAVGSGLDGDAIGDHSVHGGNDQAVYAYAREDLDWWQDALGQELGNGQFGENLTTRDIDVTDARIGEQWHIGTDGLVLEVSAPRIPCRTFAAWLDLQGWVKTFTVQAIPGAYLRVVSPGAVRKGDCITVRNRPEHDVSVGLAFRALTREQELLPQLLDAHALPARIKETVIRRS
ncbi:MOSC domain-containing protein [Mycobacterium sp. CBMA271]|uniref:MOSC domain-containing protein n=1 Tax=unclassified Mycobacteroides TaxID=2618759 RepID=UPI001322088F|nr:MULTISPECIES: MOSC domain-containing protein [unclassified Mycobacteroides]MUM18734.1 molybdenum cofactor biosysynthesis protein [Mycobacteroides sp. CBMA 326]MUM22696.1 MOSC domain-containing protein [Mycobacteroides sp. CBMA 271]